MSTFWWIVILSIGPAIGVWGAWIGTRNTLRNSICDEERRFVIRSTVRGSLGMLTFLVWIMVVPQPWNWTIWAVYGPALALWIRHFNRRQKEIREQAMASV